MENEETIKLIELTLEKVRPFLQRDGGDVTFDSYEDGIVYLNVHGACEGCALIDQDIQGGIEVILMEEVPGIIAVRNAADKKFIHEQLKKLNANKEK